MRRLALAAAFAFALSLSLILPPVRAQLPQASDTTSPPNPAAGHDYLGAPSETVNPANGSTSIRLPVRVSPGRQLTIPLFVAYDSAGAFYYGPSNTSPLPHWATILGGPTSQGGWSYTLPLLTHSTQGWLYQGPTKNFTCEGGTNYVFQDATGNRHNLGLAPIRTPIGAQCGGPGIDQGGEGPILATTQGPCCGAATVVTDGNGTVYQFGSPNTVTDRNGNTISIAYSGTPTSSATVTDTVGRAALTLSFGTPDTITAVGLSSPYKVSWTTASASFTINAVNLPSLLNTPCPTSLSGSVQAISQVVLPNGRNFTLAYDGTYGMLNKMSYPSGGYVRYVWGLAPQKEYFSGAVYDGDGNTSSTYSCRIDYPAITDRFVSFDGTTEVLHQHFAYSTNWQSGSSTNWTSKTTTVITTDQVRNTSFTTVYSYTPINSPCVPDPNPNANDDGCVGDNDFEQMPVEQCIEYYDSSGSGGIPPSPCPNLNPPGKLLRTEIKSWFKNDPRTLGSVQTVLDNGQPSLLVNCYDSNEQLTETDEYDFGTSAPTLPSCAQNVPSGTAAGGFLRATVTNYKTFGTNHVVDRPSSVIVYSDSGKTNRVAETDFTYDSPAGATTSGIVQHNTGCNCGNLTKQAKLVNSSGTTLNTTFTNDDTGQRLTMTDPNGNQTSYSYVDSYSSGTPPGPTDAYLTQITYSNTGVAHIEKFAYAYASGQVTSSTDQNSQVTGYKYVDNFARLTEIDYPTPDGGVTTKTYVDTPLSVSVETKSQIDSSHSTDSFVLYDGLMHAIAASSANGETTPWDRIDSCYDGQGLVRFRSYHYQISSSSTAPNCSGAGDSLIYDALGRLTKLTHSDNTAVQTTYTGRATEVQDEGNGTRSVSRVSQVDGLGRLLSVCEESSITLLVGSSPTPSACGQDIGRNGFLTSYTYDTLGNLKTVTQTGLNGRSFSYDFLSRLTSATNPESGPITYNYDSDSNCATPNSFAGDLVSKIDARSIRTCVQYDALNRLTQKNYSDGTPTANFFYDQTSAYGVTLANTIGRKSSETTASPNPTAEVFSYDELGRVKINGQCTPLSCSTNTVYPLTYVYDLLGDMTSSTNGQSNTYGYTYNIAQRLLTMTSNAPNSPTTMFSAAHYNAAGLLTGATLGNNIAETRTYDARLRLSSITDGTVYSVTIPASGGYAPNSNILIANDSVNGNWTYGYDDFNHLLTASATGQAYTYDYDRYGNRWHQNGPHTSSLGFDANNRIVAGSGVTYDANGNTTNDGTTAYTFDAENRLTSATNTSRGLTCYIYNAEGQRVRKTYSTVGTCAAPTSFTPNDYLYDLSGHLINIIGIRNEVFAGNRHLASYTFSSTYFMHADWLGTERARSNISGASYATCTSLPFGDSLTCAGGSDPSPDHFTGKQHDYESGLENFEARFDSSSMGRFMSPDWSDDPEAVPYANLGNPQTLNLYTYVGNNPITTADEDGHDPGQNTPKPAGKCGLGCWLKIIFSGSASSSGSAAERAQGGPSFWQLLEAYRWTSDPDLKRAIMAQMLGIKPFNVPTPMGQNTVGPPLIIPVPTKLLKLLELIDTLGSAAPGYEGGRDFANDGRRGGEVLPATDSEGNPIKYREWDVNPVSSTGRRDAERIVTGSNGSAYYTDDHYKTFKKIR